MEWILDGRSLAGNPPNRPPTCLGHRNLGTRFEEFM